MGPIGIFGGTFDPIHFGHLRAALEVQECLGLSAMRFVPSFRPPHRSQPVANPRQRLDMVRLAVEDQPGFIVDDREITRGGLSYMVDTLASLRAELGEVTLCLFVGMDAYLGLDRWHRWREIPDLAHLVVGHRPGSDFPRTGELASLAQKHRSRVPEDLSGLAAGRVLLVPLTQLDISATRLRDLIADGRDPRYLMPDRVRDYVLGQQLYRGKDPYQTQHVE